MPEQLPPDGRPCVPAAGRALLDGLRARIGAIERRPPLSLPGSSDTRDPSVRHASVPDPSGPDPSGRGAPAPWRLGIAAFDDLLGPAGLDRGGVHEVRPALPAGRAGIAAAEWAAALGFALRLAALSPAVGRGPVLLCASERMLAEIGRPYGAGLAPLGLAAGALLLVEAARAADVLWAIEEGLRCGGIGLAVGLVDEAGLTAARRLSLASSAAGRAALLLTHPGRPAAAATATRWRVGPAASAPHPFDPKAPGASRLALTLERCLRRPLEEGGRTHVVEWSDATHRFRLAAAVADRAPGTAGGRRVVAR